MYSVRVEKTKRYVRWCDSHWYGTDKTPLAIFSLEEAKTILKQLEKHYVYKATITDYNGNPIPEYTDAPVKTKEKPKKSLFSLSLSDFKNRKR